MRDPIVNHKGRSCGVEISVIERQEILILICEALDGVCGSLGKVPDVACLKNVDLVFTILIYGGN